MTDEGYVYLLWEDKYLLGVYLNEEDAKADADTLGGRVRFEQWYVDTEAVAHNEP